MVNTELKEQLIEFISLNYGFPHWEKKFNEISDVPVSFFGAFVLKYHYDLPTQTTRFHFKLNIYKAFRDILADRRKLASIIKTLSVKYLGRETKFTFKWNTHMNMWFIYMNHLDLFIDEDFNKFVKGFKNVYKIDFKVSILTDADGYAHHTQPEPTPKYTPTIFRKKSTKEDVDKVVTRIKEILSV